MRKHPVSPMRVQLRVWNSFYEYFKARNFYFSKYKKNVFFLSLGQENSISWNIRKAFFEKIEESF